MSNDRPIEYAKGAEVSAQVPPEPPVETIGMDRFSVAWQRLGRHWHRAGLPMIDFAPLHMRGTEMIWANLVVHRGPIRLLHVPTTEEKK
jgi:hypothetical protein